MLKPGQPGNPNGRPKKSKELTTPIRNERDKSIVVKEGGHKKRITKREALVAQLFNRAIKGDAKPLQIDVAHLQSSREIEPFVSTEIDDAELVRALSHLKDTREADDGTA